MGPHTHTHQSISSTCLQKSRETVLSTNAISEQFSIFVESQIKLRLCNNQGKVQRANNLVIPSQDTLGGSCSAEWLVKEKFQLKAHMGH